MVLHTFETKRHSVEKRTFCGPHKVSNMELIFKRNSFSDKEYDDLVEYSRRNRIQYTRSIPREYLIFAASACSVVFCATNQRAAELVNYNYICILFSPHWTSFVQLIKSYVRGIFFQMAV